MADVLPKRRILMRYEKSHGDQETAAYTTTPDHNIQSTAQSMIQALRASEHLRHMGAVLHIPLCSHLIDTPGAHTVFLEEEDHRREGRVASSKTRYRELSGGREDEGYKGNAQTL